MAYVESHDCNIYYETWGEGDKALVFAHGMGGNAGIWYQQVAAFMGSYRIITFDHRYFARSGGDASLFRPECFPDDVMAIMDVEGVQSAVFVCQSMGGWTGSQMAIKDRDRIDGLLMSHTPGVFENAGVELNRPVNDIVSRPFAALHSPAVADDFPEKNLSGAVLYAQISAFNGIDPAVIPRGIGAANLGVDTATLTDYDLPTLFVTADKDVLFPADYITALAATVPGADCVNLGDAGHSSYFETPDAFNRELGKFLHKVYE